MAYYTCLLLDVDNTLLDFDAAERQALTDTLTHYGLPCDAAACDTYHQVNRKLWTGLAKGEIGRSKLFAVRFARFLQAMGLPDNGKSREINDYYEEQLALHPDILPGALTALDELAEVATLAIDSNGAYKVQQARIHDSGIEPYMDGVYISEKVGAAKPSAKLFDHALKDLGVTDRSRVLVVGDDLNADIKGGRNAGLDTCWVNFAGAENDTGIQPKHTITSYEELYRIVMEPEELENLGVRNPPPPRRLTPARRGAADIQHPIQVCRCCKKAAANFWVRACAGRKPQRPRERQARSKPLPAAAGRDFEE